MIERKGDSIEKRLSPRERSEPEAIARLRSEATLLERLAGTGATPRLLARGEDARGPWHRLEWVPLPTLAQRIERAAGSLAPGFVEAAALASFTVLAMLHEAVDASGPLQVVHGDPSPANLALDDPGTHAVLLDLDLAWWREAPERPADDGAFRGTIGYAAPEVARGERPTVRSDLFSLAAALLHAVLGTEPRPGDSFPALLATAAEVPLLRDEHHALALRGPGHAAILACLAHAPEARPQAAREVIARLRP